MSNTPKKINILFVITGDNVFMSDVPVVSADYAAVRPLVELEVVFGLRLSCRLEVKLNRERVLVDHDWKIILVTNFEQTKTKRPSKSTV